MQLCSFIKPASSGFPNYIHGKLNRFLSGGFLCLVIALLSGCGPLPDFGSGDERPSARVDVGSPLKVPGKNTPAGNDSLLVPPVAGRVDTDSARQSAGSPTMPNGLPALQPLKGVKVEQLFAENIRDSDQRFERLENAVVDLRREFEAVKPAIVRLVAVESDIQDLVSQLEVMLRNEPDTAPSRDIPSRDMSPPSALPEQVAPAVSSPEKVVEAKPEPAPEPAPAQPSAPAASTGKPVIENVRIAESGGKTRVVFDSRARISYDMDYDSAENIIVLTAKNAGIDAASGNLARKSSKIKTIEFSDKGDEGSMIVMSLSGPATVSKGTTLSPNADSPHYRYFFDIR